MRIATAHVRVARPADTLFAYLSDVGNLPEWSTEFVQSFERAGDAIRAVTGAGEVTIRTRSDRGTGVVDIVVEPDGGDAAVFPGRVAALADGTSFYAFTMMQAPGQPDERFAAEFASLQRELENIPNRLSA